jgi:glycine/D-amino acid oxidase-like deaminating enzyme
MTRVVRSAARRDRKSLTTRRDLRSGKPVWSAYPSRRPRGERLARISAVDVLVIGCGISGILLAHELLRWGRRPVIVDRRPALQGSTPASTALLQFEIDVPLIHLAETIGQRAAQRAWRCSREAVTHLHELIASERIVAAVSEHPSLYLAGNVLDLHGLRRECRARQRAGLSAELLSRSAVRRYGIARAGAIRSTGNFVANPLQLASSLLRASLRRGARLHTPVEVVRLDPHRHGVVAWTRDERAIRCNAAALCTGYETSIFAPRNHQIASTWAIATRPQPRNLWPDRCLIWEASDPYLYVRATSDGRVICGGEDESYSDEKRRDAAIGVKSQALERKLGRLFPALDPRAQFRWAGTFGSSSTGLPTIGPIPGLRHCFATLGYGGNGITFSTMGARIVARALHRCPERDDALFAFAP